MAEKKKTFREIKEDAIRNGGYHVALYFDIHGNSPKALTDIMVGFVGKLTNAPGVAWGVGEIDQPIEHQDLYSTTAKVDLIVENLIALVRLCLSYGPIGVEIEEPLEIKIPPHEMQQALLEMSATSQEFTNMVLNKVMTPEEKAEFSKKMGQRVLLGKRLMENAAKEGN